MEAKMIAVIADDFTGAAEIAGLGLRYGLKVEIESQVVTKSDADLLIIATDTRSMESPSAYQEVFRITKQLEALDCEWIYKKVDSVFRGHVYRELLAMLEANGIKKTLLVPANPEIGRRIENGIYYIDDQLIHETDFSEDPEYPVNTSRVVDLMKSNSTTNISLLSPGQPIDHLGISIGEACTENDLKVWAAKIDHTIIPAGGAAFFKALLEAKGFNEQTSTTEEPIHFGKKFLFVCGSAFSKGKASFRNIPNCKENIIPMPEDVFYNTGYIEEAFREWEEKILLAFFKNNFVILEIDQPVIRDKHFAKRLRQQMARIVDAVLKEVKVNEVLIDGGATVYSIVDRVGLNKFFPVQELAPGVLRMRIQNKDDLYITIKPGSYPWPEKILGMPCLGE